MTQVVTISAHTAAYAAEPLKASARVSGATPIEATVRALSEKAMQTGDAQQKVLMNVVRPPALALFFLTTSQHNQPQTTRDHAEEQYLSFATEEESGAPVDAETPPLADEAPVEGTGTLTADALDTV